MRSSSLACLAFFGLAAVTLTGCDTISDIFDSSAPKLPGKRVSVLVVDQKLKIDPSLAKSPVAVPPPVNNPEWPQIGGNSTHNLGHLSLDPDLKQVWSVSAGEEPQSHLIYTGTPIVADGKIFVLDTQAEVTALDAATGKQLWRVRVSPQDARTDTLGGGMAYGGGKLFVAAGYPELQVLDPANGGLIWRKQLTAPPRSAITYANEKVFIVTLDNQTQVLNTTDGSLLWGHAGLPQSEGVLGEASPAVDATIAVVPYSSGEVFSLRLETGRVAWQDNLVSIRHTNALWSLTDISTPPVIDHGTVFSVSEGGRLVAIDERSGARLWQHEVGSNNMPWVAGDYVFMLDTNNELVCISRTKGGIHWISQLQSYEDMQKRKHPVLWQGPILAGGRLILTNSLGQIVEASPEDGRVVQVTDASDAIAVSPIVANGMLYILTDDGQLAAYR